MTTEAPIERTIDEEGTLATITAAFIADPVMRWLYPGAQDYLKSFPTFVQMFVGQAFQTNTAYRTADHHGAALWLPPDVRPDEEAVGAFFQASVAEERQTAVFSILEQLGNYHPTAPHWYLPLLGVDPTHQGRGYGSALLAQSLQACDETGLPAYLESSNERNVPLYERFGFEVQAIIQSGDSPRVWPMVRPAR